MIAWRADSARHLAALLCFPLAASMANAATLTFDGTYLGPRYTEAGMTIEKMPRSDLEVTINDGFWGNNIAWVTEPPGPVASFRLSTGGAFDLLSVVVVHLDPTDPYIFRGYRNGKEVSRKVLRGETQWDPYPFTFTGFTGLDYVPVMTGPTEAADMKLDDLTFAPVPLPAALPLLGLALGLLAIRGRPWRGSPSTRPRSPAAPTGGSW